MSQGPAPLPSARVSLGYEAVIAEEDVDTHERQIPPPRCPEKSAVYQDPTLALGAFLGVAAVQADVGVGGQDVHPELSRLLVYPLITLVSVGHDRTLPLASVRLLERPQVLPETGHRGARSFRPQGLVFESVFE